MKRRESKLPLILTLIAMAFIATRAYHYVQEHRQASALAAQPAAVQAGPPPRSAPSSPSAPPLVVPGIEAGKADAPSMSISPAPPAPKPPVEEPPASILPGQQPKLPEKGVASAARPAVN